MTQSSANMQQQTDRWTWTLAVLLVLLWVTALIVLMKPEVPGGHGFQHARYSTMDQGGDGALRHEHLLTGGWVLGSIFIATFVGLLACGTAHHNAVSWWRPVAFVFGGLLYEGVFGMLCLSYRNSLTEPYAAFSGLLPGPLSWLLIGIWFVPGIFIVLYTVFFYRWIWPPDNARRFSELIARSSQTNDSQDPR